MSKKEQLSLALITLRLNFKLSSHYIGKITIPMLEESISGKSDIYVTKFWRAFHRAEQRLFK